MLNVQIKLNTVEDVRDFADIVSGYDINMDLSSGRYIVDAKSVMGIFSLDLSSPVTLTAHTDDYGDLLKAITNYIVQ